MNFPVELGSFLNARLASADIAADWAVGGAWLTGDPSGPPLPAPGHAASLARALGDWIALHTDAASTPVHLDGAQILAERAAYTGRTRAGNVSVGGASRMVNLHEGWAAVSCARTDDPMLYGALLGTTIDPNDPWPAITAGLGGMTADHLRQGAVELGLPAWPIETPAPFGFAGEPRHPRPLNGARVVDFSSLWAGPLCSSIVGLAGAEVIKVESVDRLDGARQGDPRFYRLLHGGHRSVVFDPQKPDDLAALDRLVASADIVIEASRPRALRRFGINAQRHVDRGATWISITAAGRRSNRIGFGDDIAASSGIVARGPQGTPQFVGDAIADPLTGLVAAAYCVSAPPSPGELCDLSMAAIAAATMIPRTAARGQHRQARAPVQRFSGNDAVGATAPPAGADTHAVLGPCRATIPGGTL